MNKPKVIIRQLKNTSEDHKLFAYFDKQIEIVEKRLDPTLWKPAYNNIPKVLASKDCKVLVMYINKQPIGYIVGKIYNAAPYYQGHHGYIECIYVEKDWRRHGFAHTLFLYIQKWMKSRKILVIKLRTLANNTKAVKLYKKWGFETKVLTMTLEK